METLDIARWPFQKVLIANRGEIAVRVIRACREIGLTSVAVYSDVDRNALHVRLADEAFHIGPAPASQSYLSVAKLLDVARRSGAQAVHPGYGFLSENADFVDACHEAGLTFIGPSAEAMRGMGEKTAARRVAKAANVPIVPGAMADVKSDEEALSLAEEIGYPLMLKAAGGGGGKGIRVVRQSQDLLSSLRTARSEAQSAFSDDRVYLEKAISPARHVEIQFIADTHGNVVHLGERECSIQRRHQKLIEESPSPILTPEVREQMTSATKRLIRSIGYVNAGTAEFLVGPDLNFYFLEVNARLQVEHPVTEWCTGLDLVREQLRIAAGLPLSFTQEQVQFRGAAIECRISAEDPFNRFLPATGMVQALQEPGGPGVRVDSSLYPGLQVPLFYDPLLAKLIVWADDRPKAIERMRRAVSEYQILGVRTSLPFVAWLMRQPRFQMGDFSTDFIAQEWETHGREEAVQDQPHEEPSEEQLAALISGLLLKEQVEVERLRREPVGDGQRNGEYSRWREAGRRDLSRRV